MRIRKNSRSSATRSSRSLATRAPASIYSSSPGETLPYSVEFHVPRGRFDRLTTYIASLFTKDDAKPIPTTMTIDSSGRTRFHVSPSAKSPTVEYNAAVGEIDLKAK
jgi:hypothetical protein